MAKEANKDVIKETEVSDATKETETAIATKETETNLTTQETEAPMGFEDEDSGDMIIPRIKVIQTLSPERKEGTASEGDIINSLTKDK